MTTATTPIQSETKSLCTTQSTAISSSNDCAIHGLSQTPHLDNLLQNRSKHELQGLADAIESLTHGDHCAKCAVQAAVSIITGFVQELYTAKKDGKLSKEEKKALKSDVKGLVKGVKDGIKEQRKKIKSR
ncbi:hypothetical protein ACLX1H_000963 [Fusarium chlamydosporum]